MTLRITWWLCDGSRHRIHAVTETGQIVCGRRLLKIGPVTNPGNPCAMCVASVERAKAVALTIELARRAS